MNKEIVIRIPIKEATLERIFNATVQFFWGAFLVLLVACYIVVWVVALFSIFSPGSVRPFLGPDSSPEPVIQFIGLYISAILIVVAYFVFRAEGYSLKFKWSDEIE